MLIKNKTLATLAAAIIAAGSFSLSPAFAQDATTTVIEEKTTTTTVVETTAAPAAAAAEPTVEQRLADLEAYVNNGARTPDVASKIAGPGPGHNAWQMTSTALVLFMTLPGLALFYGGLVRSKNVLSVLAMTMGIAGLVTILWFLCGYSLTFSGGNAFLGDLAQACFNGMKPGNVGAGYYWISDYIWAMFQLTFAIITPALIFGARPSA
jgi:Amt family ammonium transporter